MCCGKAEGRGRGTFILFFRKTGLEHSKKQAAPCSLCGHHSQLFLRSLGVRSPVADLTLQWVLPILGTQPAPGCTLPIKKSSAKTRCKGGALLCAHTKLGEKSAPGHLWGRGETYSHTHATKSMMGELVHFLQIKGLRVLKQEEGQKEAQKDR